MTTSQLWTAVALLGLLLVVRPSLDAQTTPTDVLNGLMRADNAGDLEGVLALYADDAVLLPPNEPLVSGRAAIRARYTRVFGTTRMEVRFEPDVVRMDGSLAYLRGHTIGKRVSVDGSKTEDLGNKFLMVFTRNRADWRIAALMWSPDR